MKGVGEKKNRSSGECTILRKTWGLTCASRGLRNNLLRGGRTWGAVLTMIENLLQRDDMQTEDTLSFFSVSARTNCPTVGIPPFRRDGRARPRRPRPAGWNAFARHTARQRHEGTLVPPFRFAFREGGAASRGLASRRGAAGSAPFLRTKPSIWSFCRTASTFLPHRNNSSPKRSAFWPPKAVSFWRASILSALGGGISSSFGSDVGLISPPTPCPSAFCASRIGSLFWD